MATEEQARSGVIVVRVWRQGGAMVTKVLTTSDMEHPEEEASYCSSADEVCDVVRRFLAPFERR